ncbi:hypothetical protein ACQY0O_005381 [Thecaphora frezii]
MNRPPASQPGAGSTLPCSTVGSSAAPVVPASSASSSSASAASTTTRPPLLPSETSQRPSLGLSLILIRTHSHKHLYDADAASVHGEFGSYGHASEEPIGPIPVSRLHSRTKLHRHETVLERIRAVEKEDAEQGARYAREVEDVRAGGAGRPPPGAVLGGIVDLEKGEAAEPPSAASRSTATMGPEDEDDEKRISSSTETSSPTMDGPPTPEDPYLVTWSTPDSNENPRNWSQHRRWAVVVLVSSYTFLSPLASSMIAPALPLLSQQFHVTSHVQKNLMLSTFVLAYALGPLFLAPLSEMFGRRLVLQTANVVFIVFNIACGTSQTSTQLTVFRFFAGLGGSAPLAAGGGTIADLFGPAERGMAMALYSLAPLLGPAIGPIVGGWIVQETGKWRWIFWASSMYGGLTAVVGLLLLPETYAPRILHLRAARLRKETGDVAYHTIFDTDEEWHVRFLHHLVRPFILLTTQPIVQVLSALMTVLYGSMYILLTVFPSVFEQTYGEKPGVASLNYISLGLGFTVGGQVGGRVVDRIYRRLRDQNSGVGMPEYKLPLLKVTSFFLPAGLLVYGWSAEERVHWFVPNLGAAIFATGLMGSFVVCQGYLVDVMPLYAASTLAAAVFMRSLGGFGFPLFAPVLYDKLGQGWGVSGPSSVVDRGCARVKYLEQG